MQSTPAVVGGSALASTAPETNQKEEEEQKKQEEGEEGGGDTHGAELDAERTEAKGAGESKKEAEEDNAFDTVSHTVPPSRLPHADHAFPD
jgi:hypothetical protein